MKRFFALIAAVCGLVQAARADIVYGSDPVQLDMPLRGTTEILLTDDYQLSDLLILSGLMDGSCKYDDEYYTGTVCFLTQEASSCTFELQFKSRYQGTYDWIKCVRVRLTQKADGIYAQAVAAFYYTHTEGVGSHSYDEVGQGVVSQGTLYDGQNAGYGVQRLTVAERQSFTRSEAIPEGTVTVCAGVDLALSGAAAEGTVPNDFILQGQSLSIESATGASFTGRFSGEAVTVTGATAAGSRQPVAETKAEVVSRASVFTTNEQLMFPGVTLDDLEVGEAAMCGNTEGMVAQPWFVTRTGDTLAVQYQQVGAANDYIKGVRIELVQRGPNVFGRATKAFYYNAKTYSVGQLNVDVPEDAAQMSSADAGLNVTGTGASGYGIRTVKAMVTSRFVARQTPEGFRLRGFVTQNDKSSHVPLRVLEGASTADIAALTAVPGDGVATTSPLTVLAPKKTLDGLEYQLQFEEPPYVKCIFLRLVDLGDNSIAAYIARACAFEASKVTVGADLSDVPVFREDQNYGLSRIEFFLSHTTELPTLAFEGENSLANETFVVRQGSSVRVRNLAALPTKGTFEVGEGANLLLDASGTTDWSAAKSYSIHAARGANVVLFGRTPGIGPVVIDGGRLTLLSRHEHDCDFGTYLTSIELKNGATMTGYTPRANRQTVLSVTGEGCATVENGIFLCMGNGEADVGFYTIDVGDTVAGAGVDLELSGAVNVYGSGNQGGSVRKTGPGTLRMDSTYNQSFWAGNRLDEGTWILAASNAWGARNPLTLAGGTLELEAGVKDVSVPSLDLQGNAALVMGEGATLDLGDSTAKAWASGATLSVTMPSTAVLSATGLTSDQLGQIRINGYRTVLMSDGTLRMATGFMMIVR